MATDTLEIFGTEYTGVTGIKATDNNSGTKTYIRPQGTKSISANGTGIDVTEYASVDVSVPSSSPTIQSLTVNPSTTQQTFNASGVDGYKPVMVSAVSQTNLTAANIKNGTTVTISNGTSDLWSVTGTYSGGGEVNIATATMTNSSNQKTSISFTLPSGRTPKAFFVRLTSQIARNSSSRYYYVFDMRWDGSSTDGVAGNTFYMYNGTLTNVTSGYSYSQSNTTFTLSSTGSRSASPGSFYNGTYELVYIY